MTQAGSTGASISNTVTVPNATLPHPACCILCGCVTSLLAWVTGTKPEKQRGVQAKGTHAGWSCLGHGHSLLSERHLSICRTELIRACCSEDEDRRRRARACMWEARFTFRGCS